MYHFKNTLCLKIHPTGFFIKINNNFYWLLVPWKYSNSRKLLVSRIRLYHFVYTYGLAKDIVGLTTTKKVFEFDLMLSK